MSLPAFNLDRFWSKITRSGEDECWPWTGSINEFGYGNVRLGGRSGRQWKAHRVAFLLANPGVELTADDHICHHCDNPPCCNPAHLYRGNYTTNTADKLRRGRQSAGAARSAQLRGRVPSGDNHWTRRSPERMNLSGLRRGAA